MLVRYSDLRRIDRDPMLLGDLGDISCYGKFLNTNNGIGQLDVTFHNTDILHNTDYIYV